MESAVISIAGYKGPIRNDIRELIEACGATFNQNFTKKTTHLVCYRAESEVYAKALLFKLEGQMLEIVNHRWIEDSAKQWRKMPEESEVYRKLGVEVDFEERLDAEKKLRMDVEAQLEEEERSRRNLQELLEQEESARQEMQQQLMEEEANRIQLRSQLEGEGQNRRRCSISSAAAGATSTRCRVYCSSRRQAGPSRRSSCWRRRRSAGR